MAALTGHREPGRLVIGIDGLVEVRQVAGRAILRRAGELAVDMAGSALHRRWLAGQREFGAGFVIDFRSQPLRRCMAALTSRGETGSLVVRVDALVEVGQ